MTPSSRKNKGKRRRSPDGQVSPAALSSGTVDAVFWARSNPYASRLLPERSPEAAGCFLSVFPALS